MKRWKVFWRAVRSYSFTITMVQILLGSVIAKWENSALHFNFINFILALVGAMIIHAASNVISDYYDYKAKVDREGTFGSSGVLVEKLLTPKEAYFFAIILFLVGFFLALYFFLTLENKIVFLIIVLLGFVFGMFYTADPFALKYRALGDFAVFMAFGPLMTLGAYFVQTQKFSWWPIIFSIPLGLLVDAVLHGNNIRDIENDKQVNIKTIPIVIGEDKAKGMYYFLIGGAYFVQLLLIIFASLPYYTLLSVLSLPLGIRLIKMMQKKNEIPPEKFAFIDMYTSQYHLTYGILFILGIFVSVL